MILTKDEILKEIKKGRIKIEPFTEDAVGPASIDLHLSNEFRIFKKNLKPIEINEDADYKNLTKLVKGTITIQPGEFVHGLTEEKITLPEDIFGMLGGRSRFARLGLLIHATASFIQPGISNKQVLEIKNISPTPLILKAGVRICQLVLVKTVGKAKYAGKFKNQTEV